MSTLLSILKNLNGGAVLVIGDIMLDSYVSGSIDRISPEAPIPVLKIQSKKEMLGGAGNVVANIRRLGAKAGIISIVGKDDNAKKVIELLNSLSVEHHLIHYEKIRTVTKTRFVSSNQQLLRADIEDVFNIDNDLEDNIIYKTNEIIKQYKVVVLSDYKKGLLSRKVCCEIIRSAKSAGIPVLVDPKGKDYSIYAGATLIKPNQKELIDAFPLNDVIGEEIKYARKLLKENDVQYCLVTLGQNGMLLVDKETNKSFAASKREVYDVSGAGDTVIATLASCYSVGASLEDSCFLANAAAGIVVTKSGTSTVVPYEIENALESKGKILALEELVLQVDLWRKNNYKIGFTNGCYDIIHAGHIHTLSFAKKHCDKLIVALNTDYSVKKLKGPERPINDETQRSLVMAELGSVDGIVLFGDDTPENLIRAIKPDVLIKGGDYKKEEVVGYDFMQSYGGEVIIAPFVKQLSTTNLISRIQKS